MRLLGSPANNARLWLFDLPADLATHNGTVVHVRFAIRAALLPAALARNFALRGTSARATAMPLSHTSPGRASRRREIRQVTVVWRRQAAQPAILVSVSGLFPVS